MGSDINARAAEALHKLLAAGRIRSAWLPGMVSVDDDLWGRVLSLDAEGWAEFSGDPGLYLNPDLNPAPDTNDPLTVDGLMRLAREAWGHPITLRARFDYQNRGEPGGRLTEVTVWWVCGLPGNHSVRVNGPGEGFPTEAGAAVAALEIAVAVPDAKQTGRPVVRNGSAPAEVAR